MKRKIISIMLAGSLIAGTRDLLVLAQDVLLKNTEEIEVSEKQEIQYKEQRENILE